MRTPFPRMRVRAAVLALGMLGSAMLSGAAGADATVYRARHRPAEELLPLAEAILAGEGSVALDAGTNALVLLGPPEVLARTLELLGTHDVAPPTVVLGYESRRARDLQSSGIRVDWSLGSGTVRVGSVVLPRSETGVVIRPEAAKARTDADLKGTLRVLSGRAGRIATGTSVPVAVRRGRHESVTTVHAESGIEVRPRVLGDGRVQLDLQPFESRLEGGYVQRAGAATTVVVEPGATVAVGSLGGVRQETRTSTASGVTRTEVREERVLLIRADVERPGQQERPLVE